jgi:beta-glucanase (GH16 family)
LNARITTALAAIVSCTTALGGLSGCTAKPAASGPTRAPASPSASVRSPVPQPLAPGPRWHLAFASDFSGSRLSTTEWGTCYPWAQPGGCTNFGNHEFEWYQPSQVRLSGGTLRLVAQRIPTAGRDAHGNPQQYGCRSGMATTYPGFRFQYGLVQWPPEIDILEYWTRPVRPAGVFFHPYPAGSRQIYAFPHTSDLSVGWHYFSLRWTPHTLEWFIDGQPVLATHYHIPQQQMYFIADLATGMSPSRGGCEGALRIGWVRIWQRR